VEVLYKDDIMTRFYKHYDWASEACATRFRSLLSAMIRSGKHVIKVLEVGAGTWRYPQLQETATKRDPQELVH
jgi:hypothetical protein